MTNTDQAAIVTLAVDLMTDACDAEFFDVALPTDDDAYSLVRDFRDDFASSDDPRLAEAKIQGPLLDAIVTELMRRYYAM